MRIESRKVWTGRTIWVFCVVLAALSTLGCSGIPFLSGTAGSRPPEPIPADASSARFQATVFEVRILDDRVAEFDARAIANKTATARDFQKALGKYGKSRVLYCVDQTVSLEETAKIVIKNEEPVVRASRMSAGGRTINTVQYQDLGVFFHLAEPPKDAAPGSGRQLGVELATATGSATKITAGMSAKHYRSVEMSVSGLTDFWKPYVMVSIDAASKDEDRMPVAYVCRVILSPAQ